MANEELRESLQTAHCLHDPLTGLGKNRYGWRMANNTLQAVKFTFNSVSINTLRNENEDSTTTIDIKKNTARGRVLCEANNLIIRPFERPQDSQNTENLRCHRCADTINFPREESSEMQQKIEKNCAPSDGIPLNSNTESTSTIRSIGSFVCRICHNAEHPERLVSPCLCKGSLTYVHTHCLEHWISTSGKTNCELCQFQYKTIQTLRYTCLQSLRMWYSHSMSQRALQEDCQMFSLLTLVAFGIVGTILVGIQYYFSQQERRTMAVMARIWTKGWLLFFLFTTFTVYFVNVYILAKGQLRPWYRWWQSAREIKLILENRKTTPSMQRFRKPTEMSTNLQNESNMSSAEEEVAMGSVYLSAPTYVDGDDGRRHALVPISSESDDTTTMGTNNQHEQQQQQQRSLRLTPQENE